MNRLLPRPLLSLALMLGWLLLAHPAGIPALLIGLLAGLIIPHLLPDGAEGRPGLRPLIALLPAIPGDMARGWSQLLIAVLRDDTRPGTIVTLPHGLRRAEARAMLGWVVTMTGGTLACRVTDETLTLHCAPWRDPEHAAARIRRYARHCGEVFP